MDIKKADELLRNDEPVMYDGQAYSIKELIIWRDIYKKRRCSFVLQGKDKNTLRVDITKCEVC